MNATGGKLPVWTGQGQGSRAASQSVTADRLPGSVPRSPCCNVFQAHSIRGMAAYRRCDRPVCPLATGLPGGRRSRRRGFGCSAAPGCL